MKFKCTVTEADNTKTQHEIELPEINTDNLEQMVDYFGADSIAQAAKGNIHVQFGKIARTMFEDNKTMEEVLATLRTYKPGAKVRVSGGRKKKTISIAELHSLRDKLGLNVSDEDMIVVAKSLGHTITEEAPAESGQDTAAE